MKTALCLTILLWASNASGQHWIPKECTNTSWEKRSGFAQEMAKAGPGSSIYAPRPFPRNQAEVIENFRYVVLDMLGDDAPDDLRRLVQAVKADSLTFRILRVENWTPDRCDPEQQRDFFYLLYVTNTETGEELSRFALNQNGLASQWTAAPREQDQSKPWVKSYQDSVAPTLEATLAEVRSRFGLEGRRAQYVTTWGEPECPVVSPCIAFLARGNYYLYRAGDLVEITPGSRSYSRAEVNVSRERYSSIVRALNPSQEWFVSVADGGWVVAKRVHPTK